MEHEEFRDRLDEWRDAEIHELLKGEFAAHLSACESCRAELARRVALAQRLFPAVGAPSPEQVEEFTRAVMARIPTPAARPRTRASFGWRTFWWAAPSLGFALAALVLALRGGSPTRIIPADSQFFIGPQSKAVAEMIFPPDLTQSRDLVAFN